MSSRYLVVALSVIVINPCFKAVWHFLGSGGGSKSVLHWALFITLRQYTYSWVSALFIRNLCTNEA